MPPLPSCHCILIPSFIHLLSQQLCFVSCLPEILVVPIPILFSVDDNFQLSKTEKSLAQNNSLAPPTLILSLCLEQRSWESFPHASPSFLSFIVSETHLSLTFVSIISLKNLFPHFKESELLCYCFFF